MGKGFSSFSFPGCGRATRGVKGEAPQTFLLSIQVLSLGGLDRLSKLVLVLSDQRGL